MTILTELFRMICRVQMGNKCGTKLIMPVIKFELQLFAVSGENFTEVLEISAPEWDSNMEDNNKLIERAIYPQKIEVK